MMDCPFSCTVVCQSTAAFVQVLCVVAQVETETYINFALLVVLRSRLECCHSAPKNYHDHTSPSFQRWLVSSYANIEDSHDHRATSGDGTVYQWRTTRSRKR